MTSNDYQPEATELDALAPVRLKVKFASLLERPNSHSRTKTESELSTTSRCREKIDTLTKEYLSLRACKDRSLLRKGSVLIQVMTSHERKGVMGTTNLFLRRGHRPEWMG